MNQAEQNFMLLLDERKISYWPEARLHEVIEPQNTKPDFFCKTRCGLSFLCEVESFEREVDFPPISDLAQFDPSVMFKRLCGAAQRAGKQLKPYENSGFPLVVALDNWRMIGIDSGKYSLARVFGETQFVISPPPSADSSSIQVSRRRGELAGSMRTYMSCVSAVLWNFPRAAQLNRTESETNSRRVRVMHNPEAITPFPPQIFDDVDDEHFTVQNNGQVITLNSPSCSQGAERTYESEVEK
ncbi:MAG TPA: hypothetical protein VLX60_08280 [Terriglobales bacterium]|nr:hypothetical protein [Terriglobales bacterium]